MTSVLMVTKYYPPFSSGGTEKYIEIFSRKLAEKGLTVAIAGPSSTSTISSELNGQVSIHRFPIHKINRVEYSDAMRKFIKTSPSDIVHFHTFDILCRYLRIGLKTPYTITTHGFLSSKAHQFNPIARIYQSQILKDNFQNAKRIFCVSLKDHENVKNLLGNQSSNLRYLPNGVDLQKFSNLNKKTAKKENALEEKIVVTQVGRFAPQKGQHIFLEAINLLPKETREKCVFILAGYPFDKEYLLKLQQSIKGNSMEKNVHLVPDANDNQLTKLYGATDIFVLPSFAEGLPLTLFEAWASKCAVIITNVGGVPYVVKNGTDGFVIPPNDPKTLSQKLTQLVQDDKTRNELAIKGFERAKNEFDLNSLVDSLIREYKQVIDA